MNEVAERQETRSPLVEFKNNLKRLADGGELVLPSNVSQEAFKNAAIVAVQDNPKILRCDQGSVFKSIRRLAAAGLVPDGKEAALVPFKTKVDGSYVEVCQAMPMVFGLIKTARNSGEVRDIRAHIVYEKEMEEGRFEYVVGDEERLTHRPILWGDRGEMRAVYAIAVLRDGSVIREFLTDEDVDKIRRSSANQRIYEKGKRPTTSDTPLGIWADWSVEMWKKSAIRRLCKRLPLSGEDLRRIQASDEMEAAMRDVTPKVSDAQARLKALQAQGRGEAPGTPDAPQEAAEGAPEVEDAEVVGDGDLLAEARERGMKDVQNYGPDVLAPEAYADGSPELAEWEEGVKAQIAADEESAA